MAKRSTSPRSTTPRQRRRPASPAIAPSPPPPVTGAEVISFVESNCYVADANVARPLILPPWLRAEVCTVYDRRSRRHLLSVARKNSKTTTCAALTLNHLCGPSAQRNTDLFSSALSRDQAALLYNAAAKMVRLNPTLSRVVKIRETAKELYCPELGTKYKALSADAARNQGLNPALVIHDELGQISGPQSDLFEALELASAAQRDPKSIVISTQAASDSDLLSTLLDDALAGHDKTTTVSLYCAGSDLDPFSEHAIRAANPSFDHFQNKSELLAMAAAAQRMPAREADYRRFTLNQRIQVATPFVSPSVWDACRGRVAPLSDLPVLYGGLDLSSVADLSAFVLVGENSGKWHAHCRFWLPQDGLADKAALDHAPYVMWFNQGHLLTTPGKVIDYDFIAVALRTLFREHNIAKVAYDPWNWNFFKPSLLRNGFTENHIANHFQEFPQTTKMMSPVLANFERLLLDGRLVHDSPVLSMNVANATTRTDSGGNRALDKRKSTRRIDGAVALTMALGVAPTAQAKAIDVATLIV